MTATLDPASETGWFRALGEPPRGVTGEGSRSVRPRTPVVPSGVGGPAGWVTRPVRYPCRLLRWEPPAGGVAGSVVRFVDTYRARYEAPVSRTLFGTTHLVLMLSLDHPIDVLGGGSEPTRAPSLLVGPQTRPLVTRMGGSHRGLHVELDPLITFRLLGVPASQLIDSVADAGLAIDRIWNRELVERLAGCDRPEQMIVVLERALDTLAEEARQLDPLVSWMWDELVASRGRIRITELVRRSGFSHRHVVARFRRMVGISPKVAARLLRFEAATQLLAAGWRPADVAPCCGYADQSHLTRESLQLSGLTPAVLATRSPDGRTAWSIVGGEPVLPPPASGTRPSAAR